jgi:hypothetical protein
MLWENVKTKKDDRIMKKCIFVFVFLEITIERGYIIKG